MGHLEPTSEQFRRLAEAAGTDDSPIVMLNLLRYAETASDGSGRTGREAYATYGAAVLPMVAAHGGSMQLMGSMAPPVIGPAEEEWDDIVLIAYPSRTAFLEMVTSAEYLDAAVHRTAALADSRLIPFRRVDA